MLKQKSYTSILIVILKEKKEHQKWRSPPLLPPPIMSSYWHSSSIFAGRIYENLWNSQPRTLVYSICQPITEEVFLCLVLSKALWDTQKICTCFFVHFPLNSFITPAFGDSYYCMACFPEEETEAQRNRLSFGWQPSKRQTWEVKPDLCAFSIGTPANYTLWLHIPEGM